MNVGDETGSKTYKFSCALCNHRSYDETVLHAHIKLHKDGDSFRCLECDYTTEQQVQLMLHSQNRCTLYKCTNCIYKCNDKTKFIDHMELHVPEFKCAYCNYSTKSESSLLIHFSNEHVVLDELACNFCSFITSSVRDFINHLRRHADERPYKCLLCPYDTHCKSTLIDHLKTHGFNLLKCDACYIKCVCSSVSPQLANRINVQSSNKRRPFSCTICFYKFTRKSNLTRHLKLHERKQTVDDNKIYCAVCGFGTFVKITLINHLRMHKINN